MHFKRSKYGAKPVFVDGIRFASQREAKRYNELGTLLAAGLISDLQLQPRFNFMVKGVKCFADVADFSYTTSSGAQIIEDAKGFKTDIYKLKKKLIEAAFGVEIKEV